MKRHTMAETKKHKWGNIATPFRLCGNIYFVGTVPASTHIIDTGDGIILIDSGYFETLYGVIDNIYKLGFDPHDIKYILHSHGHIDHSGATRALAELTGAKTIVGKDDCGMVTGENDLVAAKDLGMDFQTFTPDIVMEDGYILELGNTKIECVSTPGHTPGTFSFFWETQTPAGTLTSAMMGGLGLNTLRTPYIKKYNLEAENWREAYIKSIAYCKTRTVHINVGNHCSQNDTIGRGNRVLNGETDAFIDPQSWISMLNNFEEKFKQLIESDPL
ncbi:MAG: MBL fold metallo-hydrolase [Lentisphaerae bacterium]|nr:MBL fold metallo-hydrolase [Lentisphaerota bacterium]